MPRRRAEKNLHPKLKLQRIVARLLSPYSAVAGPVRLRDLGNLAITGKDARATAGHESFLSRIGPRSRGGTDLKLH